AGWLSEPLLHLNYDTLAEFRAKQIQYAEMRITMLQRDGQRPRARTFVGQPLREFWRRFVALGGYRDGAFGLLLATLMAWYELRTWVALAVRPPLPDSPRVTLPPAELDLSIVIVSYNVRE